MLLRRKTRSVKSGYRRFDLPQTVPTRIRCALGRSLLWLATLAPAAVHSPYTKNAETIARLPMRAQ